MGRPKGSKNKPKEVSAPETASTDVSKIGEEPRSSAPPHYRSRLAAINEVNNSNKEKAAADGESQGEEIDVSEEDEVNQSHQEDQDETSQDTELETAQEAETKQTEPVKRKFIVDGVEKEFSDDDITKIVQKHATADQRLAQATQILEDATRRAATLNEDARRSPQATGQYRDPATRPPASSADAGRDEETVAQLTKSLMYGDEQEVSKAITTLLGRGRQGVANEMATQTQGMTLEQIAAYVDEKLSFENAKKLLDTPKEQGGYADIYAEPVLREMFHQKDAALLEQGDKRPYVERFKSIGDELRAWTEGFVKKHIPATGLENRDAIKRTTGVVRGAGGKPPAVPLETKPKTHDEKISDYRRSRGLN